MIKCPNCGAELEFNAKSQLVTCEYCRSTFNPKELNEKVHVSEEIEQFEGRSYLCSQCGASLLTFDETAITFCSYCGSQAMIESKMVKQNNPEYIIPFKKTKEECIASYKKILSKSLFAPSYMKSDIVVSKFRGIYIPYCVYKTSFHGKTSNNGSKYKYRSGDYEYYDDYTVHAYVDADYDGVSYDLLSNFYDKFSHAIPHNFKEAEKFNPNYLTGFYADTSDVNSDVYSSIAKFVTSGDASSHLRKRREFLRYGCTNPKVGLQVEDKKTAMYPMYFLALRTKDNKHVNYAVVNGQTGKAVADIPIDFKKYILFALILTIPIFLLINNFLVVTPKSVCFFSIIIAFVSMIISISQVKSINNRETHQDDLGYIYKNYSNKKETNKTGIFKYIYKPLIAIIIGILVILANFVNDIYYYGASIITFVLIILSFYDLVKEHNLLVSSKLPQLEKRGGDLDA